MEQTYIPIPHYPPFKLRSSLTDKDPVIWVHLLEAYIGLCQVLLTGDVKLDVKSQQQFQLFLKVYLSETAEESSRIFSLGAINPEITANTALLRQYIFQVICDYGAVKLALTGDSLWNFVTVYVKSNASMVRGILTGAHMSKFNDNKKSGKISLVPVLRKHILAEINLGKMKLAHLETFCMLVGQQTTTASTKSVNLTRAGRPHGKVLAKDKYKSTAAGALQFAETFVNEEWIELLELSYAGGRGVNAETIKNWMVISVLSLSLAKLAKVISTLGIHGSGTMALAPLMSSIILSKAYKQMNPLLEERLPFLKFVGLEDGVLAEELSLLIDMFPFLSEEKAKGVLTHYASLDAATNALIENPSVADEFGKPVEEVKVSSTELERGLERFKLGKSETTEKFSRKEDISKEELKKSTLTAALRLLYESDEDERDDTYDDQEATTSSAFSDTKSKGRFPEEEPSESNARRSHEDEIELLLFGHLKKEGDSAFEKSSRKSPIRQKIKAQTGWSDEQIEGWLRMLKRSSKRFRLLEEAYVFQNSNRRITPQPKSQPKDTSQLPGAKSSLPADTQNRKKTHSKDEAKKAQRANHSRKNQHGKKARAELAGMQ